MLHKWLLIAATIMGFISVAAGAFGAHALKQRLSPDMLAVFEVGARYQMYHALAMFVAIWLASLLPGNLPLFATWLFLSGILVFSGSLYALALTGIRVFGAITPIGGVLLLAGWACLLIALLKSS